MKIKILQINSSSDIGGGPQVMWDIVEGLKNELDFLILGPKGKFLEKYHGAGLESRELKNKIFFKLIEELRKVISQKKPDIVHCHGMRTAFWTRLSAIGLKNRPKIIYTLHGFHIIRKQFFLKWPLIFLERILNHWTDIMVCVGESDKRLVLRYKTVPKNKIIVIKNGINIKKFEIPKDEIFRNKRELNLEDKFVILSAGRLHPQKDFFTLLRALKLIIPVINNAKLIIVGDGPLRQSLEKEVVNLDIVQHVDFLGFREDVPTLINLCDIMILSTRWEGLPLVPLEAGACKKPVIASDIDGVREVVLNGKNGFLFQVGSERDLADKISKLYRSKELRIKMGENGYRFVSDNFNKKRMTREYKNLYQSII